MIPAELVDKINTKESQHASLSEHFNSASFDERMMLFRLKAELGKLYLEAANVATVDLEARGKYLRKVVKYNPYLKPDLVGKYSKLLLGTLVPSIKKPEELAENPLLVVANTALALVALPLVTLTVPFKFARTVALALPIKSYYVNTHCLFDLENTITSEQCLSTAVGHIDKNNYYIAIRYLLEADIRSNNKNPEIMHYLSICTYSLTNPLDGEETIEDAWPYLYVIKEKVLENHPKPENSQLQFIWDTPSDLDSRTQTNASYRVTFYVESSNLDSNDLKKQLIGRKTESSSAISLFALSSKLSNLLYSAYPRIDPRTDKERAIDMHNLRAFNNYYGPMGDPFNNTSLTEIVAYMTQAVDLPEKTIPEEIIIAGRAAHLLLKEPSDHADQAALHLDLLLEKIESKKDSEKTGKPKKDSETGKALTFLPTRGQSQKMQGQDSSLKLGNF